MKGRHSNASIATVLTLLLVIGTTTPAVGTASVFAVGDGATSEAGAMAGEASVPTNVGVQTGNDTTVTILSYNDVEVAAAVGHDFPRLVTLVNRRRAAHENPTVVVSAGDQVSPHALGSASQWRPPVEILNQLDPTAEAIGNHEFDYGLAEVGNFTAASEFPWLATNLVNASTGESFDGTQPYEIVETDGTRIGIVGLLDRGAYERVDIDFSAAGLELRNFTHVGARTATMLKEEQNVDVVIAVAHIGVPEARLLASASDDVDVIAVGDDHRRFPPQEVSGTIITESVASAQYLSEINLTVVDGDVTRWNGRLVEVTDEIPKNETASRIIDDYWAEAIPDAVVARTNGAPNTTSPPTTATRRTTATS